MARWIESQCAENYVAGEEVTRLRIVLEELVLNVAAYGGDPPPSLELTFVREARALRLTVEDDGVAFDPTAAPAPNLSDDLDERTVGGLGIFTVIAMMDEVSYARVAGRNRLVLRKHLRPPQDFDQS